MDASSRKNLFIIIILMKRIFEELHCCLYVFRNSESCEIAVHKLWTRAGRRSARGGGGHCIVRRQVENS